jgi:hypothetical protein
MIHKCIFIHSKFILYVSCLQIETINNHQSAVCDLVTLTQSLGSQDLVKCQEVIEGLQEQKDDLDNVTVTLNTTAGMVAQSGKVTSLDGCNG